MKSTNYTSRKKVLALSYTALFSALSATLMMFEFSTPFIPSFVKMDFSDLPAVFASMLVSPVYGVLVCLIKNVVHLALTTTGGIGEVANFILSASFVFIFGIIYKRRQNILNLVIAGVCGAVAMGVISVPINYFITYPIYAKMLPLEAIINMYSELNPSADSLLSALLIFNLPFNIIKCLINVLIAALIFKPISPILKKYDLKM